MSTKISDLRPSDIGAVGGVGDSISTGCNALSTSLFNMKDYVGLSWILGGDNFGAANEAVTIGNAFQHYTGPMQSLSYGTSDSTSGHNWAKDGSVAQDMLGQVQKLKAGFQSDLGDKYDSTWKFVNMLIGGNNLCVACDGGSGAKNAAVDVYIASVKAALDELTTFPRTFVSVGLLPDITQLSKFKEGLQCGLALWYACDCAASDEASKRKLVQDLVLKYNAAIIDLVHSYADRDDFAVVLQPGLQNATISDSSLISDADCFHPSAVGQAGFATGLWNNLVQPAHKKVTWKVGDKLNCLKDSDRLTLD